MRAEMGGVKKYSPPRETMKSMNYPLVHLARDHVSPLTSLHRDRSVPVSKVQTLDCSGRVLSLSVALEVPDDRVRSRIVATSGEPVKIDQTRKASQSQSETHEALLTILICMCANPSSMFDWYATKHPTKLLVSLRS